MSLQIASKQEDDFSLVDRASDGDQLAFKMLVNKHQEKVRRLIYLTVGHSKAHLVDDIAQEVFIKVYKSIGRFNKKSKFTTWLYRITVNCCRDELRKQKVRHFFKWFEPKDKPMQNTQTIEQEETSAIVHKAIGQLPPKFRVPVILKDIKGFDYNDIARILDCKVGTVKSRLYRGRHLLKETLTPLKKDLQL